MRKIFFALIFLTSVVSAATLEVIGTVKVDDIYTDISDAKDSQGRLELLIFNTSIVNSQKIFSIPRVDININGKDVVRINQNTSDIIFQKGIFKYLRMDFPAGKYMAEIKQATVFNSGVLKRFEFIIQQGKSLPIILENREFSKNGKIPAQLGQGLALKAEVDINEVSYYKLIEEMSMQVKDFNSQVQIYRDEADKIRLVKKFEDARMEEQLVKDRNDRIKNMEDERKKITIAEEEKRRVAEIEKENQAKLAIELIAKEDDNTCKSFGANFGTESYVNCRLALKKSRDEQRERDIANQKIRENLEELKQQNIRQQLQIATENKKAEEKRQSDLLIYQQQIADEQRRRERSDKLDNAQRAFEAAARLSQPTQGTPINAIPQISLPQRTSCFRNGNFVDCRTQ
jgi:hypothetical protein